MHKNIFLFVILIFLLVVFVFFSFLSLNNFQHIQQAKNCESKIYDFYENNESTPFTINKIVYFSCADGKSTVNPNSSLTISDLYQYTDIAIFLNNNSGENFTQKNTLKSVNLSNIKIYMPPTVGKASLYYKNLYDFATNKIDENYLINDDLNFIISSEEEIDYSKPYLYNNCANPITLCYKNADLKSNYTLSNISNISYDGSLLKTCNITLNSIASKISFLISITNNIDETYTCPVILNIPLSTKTSSIYNGHVILNDETNYNFIKKEI